MSIIGNILLGIATLIFFILLSILFGKAPRGSDGLIGYAWSVIILNLIFAAAIILAYLIIGSLGNFEWVAGNSSSRFWLITIGLLPAVVTVALSALFKYENGPYAFLLKAFSSFAPI